MDEDVCRELYGAAGKLMTSLGIKANLDGYRYLREAICLALIRGGSVRDIQRELYEPIAFRYGKKVHCIERAVRTAIETAWTVGDLDELEKLFPSGIDPNRAKPTAGQFIGAACRKLGEKRELTDGKG